MKIFLFGFWVLFSLLLTHAASAERFQPEAVTNCGISVLATPALGKPGDACNIYVDPDTGVQTVISAFEISPQPATPGDTVTLDWIIIGAPLAILEVYDPLQPQIEPENGEPYTPPLEVFFSLPAHSSQNVTLPPNGARFVLWAADDQPGTPASTVAPVIRRMAYAIIDVEGDGSVVSGQPCMPTFRFSDSDQGNCLLPVQQVKIAAAFQSFANGFMIWRDDFDQIFVFVNGGSMTLFELASYENLPDNPVTDNPPDGSFKPVSGFGRVWGNNPKVRDSLGWATAPEEAYTSTLQFTRYPVLTTYFYLTLPGGDVVQIHGARRWNFEVSYSLE